MGFKRVVFIFKKNIFIPPYSGPPPPLFPPPPLSPLFPPPLFRYITMDIQH